MLGRRFFLLLSLFFWLHIECKPLPLAPQTVKETVDAILKAHVRYKSLNLSQMNRVLENYLEELDPTKTYFIQDEILTWTSPTEETLQQALGDLQNADFRLFRNIHQVFVDAIARRNCLELKLLSEELPQGVKSEEFQDLSWASSEEALLERLLRIHSLQTLAAQTIDQENTELFLQRLQKRRLHREALFGNPDDCVLPSVLKAVASSLDAHTNYFTPIEANQFMIQVQQRLFGIGAQLRDDLDGLSIIRILENSPASQNNQLKINDKIVAVNGEPIAGMDISEAVELIRGDQDTPVVLTLLRQAEEGSLKKFEIELTRAEVILEESRLESTLEPYGDGAIAVLRLYSFYQDQHSSSASDIRKALESAKQEEPLKGVILDLRGNAGGLLNQAVAVTGLFIQKGIVASIKDHMGKLQHLRALDGKPIWDGPLIVLVNLASASAAEIVAQTLQDYGRALVIGDEHTYGKGSFQTFTLDPIRHPKVNPQGEYKVTRGMYYTVSGKSPQLCGVSSDIHVPGILSQLDIGESFAKFPLENDAIAPNFDDDLSDISPFHRLQLGPVYKYNLQPRLTTYLPHLDTLRKNSHLRIEANRHYQNFLAEMEKKNFNSDSIVLFGQTDLQLLETTNIMKDLIFLMSAEEKAAS